MVKVKSINAVDTVLKEAEVSLFADTKEEITESVEIVGMISGYKPAFGSSVMTASGELAFMKSDGTWNWT